MTLPASPPTTSGIVVITGTNFFASDAEFPVVVGDLNLGPQETLNLVGGQMSAILQPPIVTIPVGVISPFVHELPLTYPDGFIPDETAIGIEKTEVTTSGIVVVDIFPGAGTPVVPFVPPVVINERLFPIFQGTNFERTFPEENRRVFPVLPQFSTITPGD